MRILYAEDSEVLQNAVKKKLSRLSHTVDIATNGEEALDLGGQYPYDLILLDIMLPKKTGLEVLKEFRDNNISSLIMMITAKVTIADRITGLDLGADDYLVKPFSLDELVSRIQALTRRTPVQREIAEEILDWGPISLNAQKKTTRFSGEPVSLAKREFAILEHLIRSKGRVVSREEIFEHIYDHAADVRSNAIDASICRIRRVLKKSGAKNLIETLPRVGYRLILP